jgi:uncharacterized membrane protein
MHVTHIVLLAVAWAVYGGTSFVGGLTAQRTRDTASVIVILYWMLLGRLAGTAAATAWCWAFVRGGRPTVAGLTRTQVLAPVLLPTVGNVGWVTYFVLSGAGNVSVVMPLLSTYIIVPVAYSMVVRRDACSVPKAAGLLLVLAAGALLGVSVAADGDASGSGSGSGSGSVSSSGGAAATAALFVATVASWGASDTISSSVPKAHISGPTLVALNCVGYLGNVAVVGAVIHAARLRFDEAAEAPLRVWAAVNCLYVVGWSAYTRLCRSMDGIVIVPLFGLYILIPAVAGILYSNEPATPFTIAGVACGAGASVCLAWPKPTGAAVEPATQQQTP